MAATFLKLKDITVRYPVRGGFLIALESINLDIEEGEFVCIVGPSGCGKTTLMHVVAGFTPVWEGSVMLNGKAVTRPGPDRGVVLQQPTLMPWFTVYRNVELGPKVRGVPLKQRQQTVERCLSMVGLSEYAKRAPYELSGGMQQRVAIARALANDAQMLLMDEPFGALDAFTREKMQAEILGIWHHTRKTILFITHDVEEAIFLATRVLVMSPSPGRVVADLSLPFSRQFVSGEPGETNVRAIKSAASFVERREEVLAYILRGVDANSK